MSQLNSYRSNPGNQLVTQVTRLGMADRRGAFLTHGDLTDFDDIVDVARYEGARNITRLIGAAEDIARPNALSHRDFRVGAVALAAFSGSGSWSYLLSHGANAKPVQGSDIINVHAEHILMIRATELAKPGERVTIPIMMVVGDWQPDQQTGL